MSVAFKKNLLRGLLHVLFYFDFSDSLQTKRLLLRKLLIITPNQKRVDDDVHGLKIRSKIAYFLRQCSALILDQSPIVNGLQKHFDKDGNRTLHCVGKLTSNYMRSHGKTKIFVRTRAGFFVDMFYENKNEFL